MAVTQQINYQVNKQQVERLLKTLENLNATQQRVDQSVKKNTQSYGSLNNQLRSTAASTRAVNTQMLSLSGTAKKLALALGFGGVLVSMISLFKNAFNTVRDFDKEMVNLAAVAGKTRDQLREVEKEIRRVAATSVNTAIEVAKTATALQTLGKTETEIIRLLSPVNKLSIALKAPADAAAELLVGTLNAFGQGADEAEHFADVIAKVRTSSALDFERIKDSFGFLAPTARVAGKSIEEMSAIVGVLVDNNIKAARAGRLMSSTFLKLADDGMTLEEALDEVNRAQAAGFNETELLSLASNRFGKESAALGIILASNRDRVAELTEELQGAQGTLDELTERQLSSIDAKVKILNSAWQELILTIEEGDGAISSFVSGSIEVLGEFIQIITAAERGQISYGEAITAFVDPLQNTIILSKIRAINLAEEAKQQETLNKAATIYEQALQKGFETFEQFKESKPGQFYERTADGAELLAAIQNKYNEALQDTIDLQQELGATTREQIEEVEIPAKKEAIELTQFKGDEEIRISQSVFDKQMAARKKEADKSLDIVMAQISAEKQMRQDAYFVFSSLIQRGLGDSKAATKFNIILSTADAAIGAFNALVEIPVVGPALAFAAAGTATGFGLSQLSKVESEPIPQFGEGGLVHGPSHSLGGVPAILEGDEFVMKKSAVQNIGIENLKALNDGNYAGAPIIINDQKELAQALEKQPKVALNWDEKGFTAYQQKSNHLRIKRQSRYSWK